MTSNTKRSEERREKRGILHSLYNLTYYCTLQAKIIPKPSIHVCNTYLKEEQFILLKAQRFCGCFIIAQKLTLVRRKI